MTWDKKNKEKLFLTLEQVAIQFNSKRKIWSQGRENFCNKWRILPVTGERMLNACVHEEAQAYGKVIIYNPWAPPHLRMGLSVPKDFAEKFLVLGIP